MSCAMNGNNFLVDHFSVGFKDHIREVCSFAKSIPGFKCINYEDQVILLKAAVFEVTLVKLSLLFDNENMMCFNGEKINKAAVESIPDGNTRLVTNKILEISKKMNLVGLSEAETGLFCSVMIITPNRSCLKNPENLVIMQSTLKVILLNSLVLNHPQPQTVFNKLMDIMHELQILNTLYAKTVHQEKSQKGSINMNINKKRNIGKVSDSEKTHSLDKKEGHPSIKVENEQNCYEPNLVSRYPLLKRALEQPAGSVLIDNLSKCPAPILKRRLEIDLLAGHLYLDSLSRGPDPILKRRLEIDQPAESLHLDNLSIGPSPLLKRRLELEQPAGSLLENLSGASDPLLVRPHKKFRHGERMGEMSYVSQCRQQIQKSGPLSYRCH